MPVARPIAYISTAPLRPQVTRFRLTKLKAPEVKRRRHRQVSTASAPKANWKICKDFGAGSECGAFAPDHDVVQEGSVFLRMPIHDMCIIAALAEGVNCQQIKIMQDGNKVWGVSGEAGDVFAHALT